MIASTIQADFTDWEARALDGFRRELVVLSGEKVSIGNAPVGLLTDLEGYVKEPARVFNEPFSNCWRVP